MHGVYNRTYLLYAMLYKYGKRTSNILGRFYFDLSLVFYSLWAFLIKKFSIKFAFTVHVMTIAISVSPKFETQYTVSPNYVSFPEKMT